MQQASLREPWQSFLLDQCQSDLEALVDSYPDRQSVVVDLTALHATDEELTRAVLDQPERALSEGRDILRQLADLPGPVQLRVENNPHLCRVSEVDAQLLHDLVTIEGVVETIEPVNATVVSSRFRCPKCSTVLERSPAGVEPEAPNLCQDCGWDGGFDFLARESEFIDTQRISLGPIDRDRQSSGAPSRLPVYLRGDLVGAVTTEEHVGVTGILRVHREEAQPTFQPFLDALNVRQERDLTRPDDLESALESYWNRTSDL